MNRWTRFPALAALCLTLVSWACGTQPQRTGPPHIVIFLADDLGWVDVGFQGGPIPTPHVDRIARGGVRLNQFYVQPLCSPTRAALLTGRYPIRYGLQVGVIHVWDPIGLPPAERTLAEALRDAGYRTAITGKWHLGFRRREFLPTERGFDHQYGSYAAGIDYFAHTQLGGLDWHRDDEPLIEEGYATELLAGEAERLIADHDLSRPLFLYVPFQAVHVPHQAPEVYLERFRNLDDEGMRTKAAMIATMDDAVGRVLAALEDRGMLDDSIVVFTSDNGGAGLNGDLRGEKGALFEGGVRVPTAVMWPRGLGQGRVVDEPIHVVDLYPTLLRLAGASTEQPLPLDGLDVWETIAGREPSPRKETLLHLAPSRAAIRVDDWKLTVQWRARPPKSIEIRDLQLFDLASDPGEAEDLAGRRPEVVEDLLARLKRYAREAAPPLRGVGKKPPPGYVIPDNWGPDD